MSIHTASPASNDFYRVRTPLEAAEATVTTERGTYYATGMCYSSPNHKTARFSISVTRVSDGKTAPSVDNLLVKRTGYASAAGIGSWNTYREAVTALLDLGVQWLESVQA